MFSLEEVAGVDPADPEVRLAVDLAREDRLLLRKLKSLRRLSGLTQREVASRLGITQPAVAEFERHDSDPKLSTIRRYAQVIGASITHSVAPRWHVVPVAVEVATNAHVTPVDNDAYTSGRAVLHSAIGSAA